MKLGVIITLLTTGLSGVERQQIDTLNCYCYDHCADAWNRFPFKDFLPTQITTFFNKENSRTVLDIGSGTGSIAIWLKNLGFQATCLDPSTEMVRRTRQMGLITFQDTIQNFSTDQKFGMVLAILSLIHVPKNEFPNQIQKIHKLLEPKGLFVLAMIEGEHEGVKEAQSEYPRFFAEYQEQEILEIVQPNGFQLLDYRRVPNNSLNYLVFFFCRQS